MNKFVFRGLDTLDADYFCRCLQTVITNFKSYTSLLVFYKILCIQYTLLSLENLIITASNDAEYCQCLAARTE